MSLDMDDLFDQARQQAKGRREQYKEPSMDQMFEKARTSAVQKDQQYQTAQQRTQTIQSMQTKKAELDERKLGVSYAPAGYSRQPQEQPQYISPAPIVWTLDSAVSPIIKQNSNVSKQYATAMPSAPLIQQATEAFGKWNQQYEQEENRYLDNVDRVSTLSSMGTSDPEANRRLEQSSKKLDQTKAQWNEAMRQTLDMLGPGTENLIRSWVKDAQDKRTISGDNDLTAEDKEKYQRSVKVQELSKLLGSELFGEVAEYIRQQENAVRMQGKVDAASELADEHGFVASLNSVPKKIVGGVAGVLDTYAQGVDRLFSGSHAPLDWNTELQTPGREANAIRSTVAQNIREDTGGEFWPFIYNTGMSMADSAALMPLGGWSSVIQGAAAFNDLAQEAKARGASDDQAMALGLIGGVTEVLTEKVSIDSLFNLESPEKIRDILRNAAKQAIPEASEEAISEIVGSIADVIIMGDKSEFKTKMREYEARGYNRDQAMVMALGSAAGDVVLSAAGGALSGFAFGSIKSAGDYALNRMVNSVAQARESTAMQTEQQAQPAANQEMAAVPSASQAVDSMIMQDQAQPAQVEIDPSGYRQTARQILNENIFESQAYGTALEETELTRGEVRQALRDIARGNQSKATDFNVQTVLQAIREVENNLPAAETTQVQEAQQLQQTQERQQIIPDDTAREQLNEAQLGALRDLAQQNNQAQTAETNSANQPQQLNNMQQVEQASATNINPEANSQDQLNGPIMAAMNELNGQKAEQTADGVGAKTSDFEHKVAPSQTHGLEGLEAKIGTPKEQQTPIEHEVITNAETKNNARLRLEQDYEGEKTQLLETNRWNSEEAAMSDVILSDLKAEAEKTGDWSAYSDFREERAARISDAARVLQLESQNAQPRSGDAILESASEALDKARKSTDKDAVMDTVSEYAKMYDKANADKSISALRDIIQAVAVERKNASFFTRILKGNEDVSNMMNWALNRVCKYAEAELQQEAAQADVVPVFEAGERVHATDLGNTGTIVKQLPNGNYLVYFLNKETGHSATEELPVSVLKRKYGSSAQKVSAGAPDGGFYEFLQNLAANSIKSIATDKEKTGVGNAILTIKRMAHLSKGATTIRNLISNNVFDVVDSVSNNISVPLDMLLSQFTGTRSVAVDKSWFSSEKRTGSIDGLAMSLLEVGLDASSAKTADAAKYGTSRRTFHKANGAVSSLISTMEKYQGYMLNATDEWQKGGIEAEAQRGIDELYAQGKIADDSLREVGKETARYRTFQDDSKLSKMSSKLRQGLNELTDDIPGGVRAGDFTMPFIQVGSNLVSRVSEYSPVGLTTNLVRLGNILWQCHEGKTITAAQQAKAVKGIGRGINGSALIAAATWLAAKGIIHIANASGGEDDDKVASDSSKGLTGIQVNWSALHRSLQGQDTEYQDGDKMGSLDYLQPFNGHMTIGALIAEDIKENDGVTFSGIANASIDGAFQQLYEIPVFQTFRDFNQAIDYSKENTEGGKLRDAVINVTANNIVGTIAPNALRGIAAGVDPYVRDEYSSDTTLGRAWDKMKGSIPGLRETLPIKQDVYGHDIETGYTGIGNFLNENINPGKNARYSPTPTTEVLDGIAQATGDNSVYLSNKVPNYVTVDGTRIDLSYDQQRQFKSERGAAFERVIPALNAAANSNGLDDQMKVKAVSIAQDYAAQVAKQSLNIGFKADGWVQELQGKSDEEIAQTIICKALESAAKKRGGAKYAGLAEQIRGGTPEETVLMVLTDKQQENYSKYLHPARVSAEVYLDALNFASKAKTDEDGQTKKEKVVAYIDGLKLTKKQKRALFLCFYSESDDTFK